MLLLKAISNFVESICDPLDFFIYCTLPMVNSPKML